MGNFCNCLSSSENEKLFTINAKPNSPNIFNEELKTSIFSVPSKKIQTAKNKTHRHISIKKDFAELEFNPLNDIEKKSKTERAVKNPLNICNLNLTFKEDFSSINSTCCTNLNFSQANASSNFIQNTLTLSNESIKNKRMIFPVLYINSGVSKKLYLNKNEIFVSYDTIDKLDSKKDIVYDCLLIWFNNNSENYVYMKIFPKEIRLYVNGEAMNLKKYTSIQVKDIENMEKSFGLKRKRKEVKKMLKFDIRTKEECFQFGTKEEIIAKSVYEILSFLILKENYDKPF